MKKTIILTFALAFSSVALMAQNKAIVQTAYSDRQQALVDIVNILENNAYEVQTATEKKIEAVLDFSKMRRPHDGQRPEGERQNGQGRPDGQNRPERPEGMPERPSGMGGGMPGGMGPGGMGPGGMGPGGMGPGGMRPGGMPNGDGEMALPTIIVKLKQTNAGVVATFKQKNMPGDQKNAKKAKNANQNGEAPAGFPGGRRKFSGMRRIIDHVPHTSVQFK